ncbi:alpha/beta hydrolase [Hyunsoonleella ulvae]|uniref:alpha/beta hydrolase n=1 Tax=Hyunsoonleella ulvae TaxID=2799948 RepID=UPI001939B625|nr:alpha/beta hydrolase [Hyunsoonleella ulvae]
MKLFYLILALFILQKSTMLFDSVDDILTQKTTHVYKIIKKDTLKLDFYPSKYKNSAAPLIIYVHGGGFASGNRDANYIADFAQNLSDQGFSVASISYRLTMKNKGFGCDVKAKHKIKAFNTTSKDISYAVKFLLDRKDTFKINPTKVVVCGTSSGAEASLNLVYVFKNRILPSKFKFAGVISMSGAIPTLDRINAQEAVPTLLFHGTDDEYVPFDVAPHHFCNEDEKGHLILYGSRAIANKLKAIGQPYYLHSKLGEPHNTSSSPMHDNFDEILDFLNNDVLKNKLRQTERTTGF